MKTGIIIQARMSSERLPGKSLRSLGRRPLIGHVVVRMQRVQKYDELILATSHEPSDDPLAEWAEKNKIGLFRGELKDVQRRFADAARVFSLDVIIRITGDNPFISPELVDIMREIWEETRVDYVAYKDCVHGIGGELFTMDSFQKVIDISKNPYDYEHVTPPYYQKKEQFQTIHLDAPPGYRHKGLRLSVDTEDDFSFAELVYKKYNVDGYVFVPDVVRKLEEKGHL